MQISQIQPKPNDKNTPELARALKQLWQFKTGISASGMVTYQPKAERALRDLKQAYRGIHNILVVRLDAIGDNFLFMDGMKKLRKLFPAANLVVITYSECKPIYDRCPFINKTLYVDRAALASNKAYRETCFKNLRECPQPWDLLLNPLYSREYVAEEIVAATPAKIKIGIAGDNSNISRQIMAMTDASYAAFLPADNSVVRHELHRNNEILSLLGSQEEAITFEALLTHEDRRFADRLICEYNLGDFGVVFPGTKGGTQSIKYWGSENYASLMDQLQLEGGWELMMLGGQGEEQIAGEITAFTRVKPHVMFGDLSIWQAAALLERARFYVGSDTSVAHIATAMKVPAFVLLGGGHYGRFFPYPSGYSDTSITHKLDCFNCDWKCRLTYNKCIADISVKDVLTAMEQKKLAVAPEKPAPAALFNLGAQRGKLPRVDLVLPPGMQTWHLKESWAMTLEKAGCLNRVFRPTPETADRLLNYLRTGGEADFLLALGGDHHLSFLHDTADKRDAWLKYRGHRVCNSYESTRDALYKRYVACVKNAMKVFTHFVFTDEVDAKIFEAAKIPALWWPQAADEKFFSSQTEFSKRKPLAFFCGKAWNEYPLRKMLLQELQSANLCHVVERAAAGEMVAHYNQHQLAINLPGVLGGFNVRTYEVMSCGNLLLQFLPSHRPANNALFEHGTHLLYYDYTDTTKLKALLQRLIDDSQSAAAIAQRGHEELRAHHTVARRFAQLVDWLFDGIQPKYPQYGEVTPESLRQSRQRQYVNDRYLFEGRPLWNSNALNEFADLQFLNYHALLPRLCQQGEQLALAKREVESLRVLKRALEADSDPDQVHNNLGVIYWNRGQRHKALEHFEAALAENPRYRPAVVNYGEALALSGLSARACEVYSNYLRQNQADDGIKTLLTNTN
jgi:ADP-heptose:LPS heptosyltransferase/tetratricopeptide (TPR) repeat protein